MASDEPPTGPSVRPQLYEREVPPSWDNLRQVFLRRARVQELAALWLAHGGAHPHLSAGLSGAYVRVLTAGVDTAEAAAERGGGFHVLQVRSTRVSEGEVQLELECIKNPVRLELLSDVPPTDAELAELQLVAHHPPAELSPNASAAAMYEEIKAAVDEERRRAAAQARAAGKDPGAEERKEKKSKKRKGTQAAQVRASGRPLRQRTGGNGGAQANNGEASDQLGQEDGMDPSGQPQSWTERQPLQRFMKVRKMVSLNELMQSAPAAP